MWLCFLIGRRQAPAGRPPGPHKSALCYLLSSVTPNSVTNFLQSSSLHRARSAIKSCVIRPNECDSDHYRVLGGQGHMEHIGYPRTTLAQIGDDGEAEMVDHRHYFKVCYLRDKDLEEDETRFFDFNVDSLMNGRSIAPYVQSWLYFGLLKEIFWHICGIDYDWRDFVAAESGRDYSTVTTYRLDTLIYLWHAREADAPAADKLKRLAAIKRVLGLADSVVEIMRDRPLPVTRDTNLDNPSAPGYPTLAAVFLSVKILGMTLCEAIPTVYGDFLESSDAHNDVEYRLDVTGSMVRHIRKVEFYSSYFNDPIVSQLLERAGYCPYQVATCDREQLSQGNLSLRWYLTYLHRGEIPGDHSRCNIDSCVGYQIDEASYTTKHVFDIDCDCKTLSLSHTFGENLILSCIQRGGTPLIRVDWPYVHIFQMGVDEPPTPPYVAISHVWSQGMGNTKENGLPKCQLNNLQYSANESCPGLENVHFWIDTLCIPVGREAERRQEIKKMASIYSGAEKVVVLDRSLMQALSKTYREEVLIRIWKSPWASRLWTLQESRLSKSLSFYFADGFYELEHVSLENSSFWHNAIHYQTNIPSWAERYEKLRDPVCYRMIELGAEFEDPESIEAWGKIKDLPPNQLSETRTEKQDCAASSSSQNVSQVPPLPASFIARVNHYNKSRFVRLTAQQSLQSIGSLPPAHRYSTELTAVTLFRVMLTLLTPRSLTRADDEAVCLATTLGVEIEPILRATTSDERMQILLTSVGTLPLGILMVDSERMSGQGRRWIPRTLLRPGTRALAGSCEVQPDDRLMYHGPALVSTRPFAVNKPGSYFNVEDADGKRYFAGIHPQSGLELDDLERTYLIIPSQPPLEWDHIPQKVAVLSLVAYPTVGSGSDTLDVQTQFEFNAWLFELALPGSEVLVNGSMKPGEYHIWQPPKEHWWRLDPDGIDLVPFVPLAAETKVLIG